MSMLILGSHSEEKGNGLEALTRSLLEMLGYQRLTVGAIGMGGQEIDVRGIHSQHLIVNTRSHSLICECKAYKNKVDLEAWLKFLGKIYSEEKLQGQDVHGCFIALSGVNGNVSGHYEDLRKKTNAIELIDGSDLEKVLTSQNRIIPREHIQRLVASNTARKIVEISLTYFHPSFFWLVRFEAGYFVLSGLGEICDTDTMVKLRPLLEKEIPDRLYVDIRFEPIALSATLMRARGLLADIIAEGPLQHRNALEGVHTIAIPQTEGAIDFLKQRLLIEENDQFLTLRSPTDGDSAGYAHSLLLFMLDGTYPVHFLGRGSYDLLIDRSLLGLVLSIQNISDLSEDESEQAITLLRLSPSALLTMLKPCQALIETHSIQFEGGNEAEFKRAVFMSLLHQGFLRDFRTPQFIGYFYRIRDLREVEFQLSYTSKSSSQVENHGMVAERWATWELEDGDLYVGSWSSGAPQPWDQKPSPKIDPEE